MTCDRAARLGAAHQPGVGEDVEMFHDRWQRNLKRLRQCANRKTRPVGKLREQSAPLRIGERSEGAIERRAVMLNHLVKYKAGGSTVKRRSTGWVMRGFSRSKGLLDVPLGRSSAGRLRGARRPPPVGALRRSPAAFALTGRGDVVTLACSIQK